MRSAFTARHGLVNGLSVGGRDRRERSRPRDRAGAFHHADDVDVDVDDDDDGPGSGRVGGGCPTSSESPVGTVVVWIVVIAGVAGLLMVLAAGRSRRLFTVPAFWTGRFLPVLGAGLAVLIAVTWFQFGGLPRRYDAYGRVSVPGQRVLALPAGEVSFDFENGLNQACTDNASEIHAPPGMVVRVASVRRTTAPLTVERVPAWLFKDDRPTYGHKPWGRIHVPVVGQYLSRPAAPTIRCLPFPTRPGPRPRRRSEGRRSRPGRRPGRRSGRL